MSHGLDDEFLRRLERAQEIGEELGEGDLADEQRGAMMMEYLEIALNTFERLSTDESSDPETRAEMEHEAITLKRKVQRIFRDQARRRLGVRWLGTELADIELGGQCVAWLMHASTGWRLTSPHPGLGSPAEWMAPPGLDEPAADCASMRALDRVAEYFGALWMPSGQGDLLL